MIEREDLRRRVWFFVLSIVIHTLILVLSGFKLPEPLSELIRKTAKKREKIVYVKILEIPKPKKKETPLEKNTPIISQFTTRKKGPLGKQEKSKLSGESPVLQPKPGLPFKVASTISSAEKKEKKSSKKKPSKKLKEGKTKKPVKKPKKTLEKKKLALKPQKIPVRKKKILLPPIPKRKIPLIDPRLVSKESKKIVPQMGKGESVEISLDTTESKYISYFKHIRDKLYLVWEYPQEAVRSGIQGTVKILFVINRKGELVKVKILESSGYSILDKEAVRAIIAASPFGPFPPDWTEKELRIRARFTYHLFSGAPF